MNKRKEWEDGREQIKLDVAESFDRYDNFDDMLEAVSNKTYEMEKEIGWR